MTDPKPLTAASELLLDSIIEVPNSWLRERLAAIEAAAAQRAVERLLIATSALPEDAPEFGAKAMLYADGWNERGEAIRAALAGEQ